MLKLKIDNDALVEEFFEDSRLLGIVAPLKYYQFTWHVNRAMGYNFRINNNLEIPVKKKERKYYYPVAEYLVPRMALTHYLYNNQYDGEFLLPEFKHLDFLWLIKDAEFRDADLLELTARIKLIPSVQLVSELSHHKIKNRQNLIL